eukprot:NODE_214_length_14327_cov_0.392325.p6 type:complete len:278 gc:universal NODE_214_length_14327_cov_0.392325:5335-4502(-)
MDDSVYDLISLLDTNVKSEALSYLTALPFRQLSIQTKEILYTQLLEKKCYEPLYNLSLVHAPINLDALMEASIKSDDACKVLMNLSRVFEDTDMKIFKHFQFNKFVTTDHDHMLGVLVNVSRLKESHRSLLEYLPSFKNHPFVIGIMKNLAFNKDTHVPLLDLLPEYLGQLAVIGFHESIINDERAMEEFEKDEISEFIFLLEDVEIKEPPKIFVELLIILLNGSADIRRGVIQTGVYYLIRHLDVFASERNWTEVNQLILNCVELILAKEESTIGN